MAKIRLAKCPNCGTSFYVKTTNGEELILVCPICRVKGKMKLEDKENGK